MSSIKIKYDELEASSKYAKKLAGELDDYSYRITKKISNPVNSLPGNDKRGYASNIVSSASAKIRELKNRTNMFDTYASNVQTFVANAQKADKAVEKSIKSTAQGYIGERSKWEAFCDNVYNFLFVDLANKSDFVRFLSDAAKSGWTYVTSYAEKAKDWFVHGDGRYVWNIVAGAAAVIATIAGAITAVGTAVAAVVAAIAGGPVIAAVLAVVAATAAVVGAIITTANSGVKVYNNSKALTEDDPAISRYVGGIDGVSEAIEKYDMGDAEDNKNWETAGNVIDTTKTVCDVIGIVNSLVDLGAVKNVRTGLTEGYKFSKSNIEFNLKTKMGFDFETNSWSFKKMFGLDKKAMGFNETDSWFANEAGEGGFKSLNELATFGSNTRQNFIKFFYNGGTVIDNTMSMAEDIGTMYDRLDDGLKFSSVEDTMYSLGKIGYTIIDIPSTFGKMKVFKGINTFLKPTNKVLGWFGVTEDNLDQLYLNSVGIGG